MTPTVSTPLSWEYYKAPSLKPFLGSKMVYHDGFRWTIDVLTFDRGYYWLGNYKATSVQIESY